MRITIIDFCGLPPVQVVSTQPFHPPYDDEDGYVFSVDDLLATDWELKQEGEKW